MVKEGWCNDLVYSVVSLWIEFAKQKNHKKLMIDTAEKSYSEEYLNRYRKMYPVIGWIGKPKNYHGSELHIYEKLGHAAYEEAKDFNKRVFDFLVS